MRLKTIVAALSIFSIAACTGIGGGRALPPASFGPSFDATRHAATSVLAQLKKQLVIGSTVPTSGDQNPYGLTIGTVNSGKIKKGNLYACNFNAKSNIQGTGSSIVGLAPSPGAKPVLIAQTSPTSPIGNALLGCAAITQDQTGTTWSAAYGAKATTTVYTSGSIHSVYKGGPYVRPFGAIFATTGGLYPTSAVFVSDAWTGSIVLAQSCSPGNCGIPNTAIITGFAVNKKPPGSILGPSGLAFDPKNCVKIQGKNACGTLYVIDGVNNTVVAIHNVLNLRNANSIKVGPTGKTFSGPEASWAKLLYAGKPLNGPISSAVLYNGNLVVGNTLDPSGTNLMVELSSAGKLLATKNVDKGTAGALFGMIATGSNAASTKLYFNDDNKNTVQVLEP
jgi:hypothetical protein